MSESTLEQALAYQRQLSSDLYEVYPHDGMVMAECDTLKPLGFVPTGCEALDKKRGRLLDQTMRNFGFGQLLQTYEPLA